MIVYSVIALMLVFVGIMILLILKNQTLLNQSQITRYQSFLLANELRQSSEDLTSMARTYVATQNSRYEDRYWEILAIRNGEKSRPDGKTASLKSLMKDAGFTDEEFAKLKESEDLSNGLVNTETISMNAIKGKIDEATRKLFQKSENGEVESNQAFALRLMYDEKYHAEKDKIKKPIDEFMRMLTERTEERVVEYTSIGDRYLTILLVLFGVLVSVIFFSYLAIQKKVISRIPKINDTINAVAKGDLTVDITADGEDEIATAMKNLGLMTAKLKEVISSISSSSQNIASASAQMNETSVAMSQGSQTQAASAEEISASMEEMAANIDRNTENAQQTEKIAIQAAQDMKEGSSSVNETVESMKKIAGKINIIGEIARQTNLLALNAAIEAARAGEHGKGFAVVASEVRKLAEHSRVAAEEINGLSSSSVIVANNSGRLLEQMVPNIQNTAKLVQEISASSLEQSKGAEQVNTAIQQLNQVVQQNASGAEEIAANAEELSAQAEMLVEVVSFFKVDNKTQPLITKKKVTSSVNSKPKVNGKRNEIIVNLNDNGYDSTDSGYSKF